MLNYDKISYRLSLIVCLNNNKTSIGIVMHITPLVPKSDKNLTYVDHKYLFLYVNYFLFTISDFIVLMMYHFIIGGYWQKGRPSLESFIPAEGF